MSLKDSLKRLFGSRPFTVDQIDRTIHFISRPSVDAMIDTLRDELKQAKADKVVVVSGFEKLNSLSGDQFECLLPFDFVKAGRALFLDVGVEHPVHAGNPGWVSIGPKRCFT